MDAQLNCETCGATFHQSNLKQKYCSATCRAKGVLKWTLILGPGVKLENGRSV
jgi:hypothetical protein